MHLLVAKMAARLEAAKRKLEPKLLIVTDNQCRRCMQSLACLAETLAEQPALLHPLAEPLWDAILALVLRARTTLSAPLNQV